MRASLVATKSRELSGLCVACARKKLATPPVHTASPAARAFSTRNRTSLPCKLTAKAAAPRRWASASAPLCAQQGSSAPSLEEQTSQPKIIHKALPYYALFPQTLPDGPPPTGPFEVDVRALRREFLQLQAASHPDFHHAASEHAPASSDPPSTAHSASRRKAEALSSHINAAYKILSSPLLRAQYILSERYGIDLAGDEASSLTGPPDADLLTEVLYARETIEDAASEKDLEGVRAENEGRIETCLRGLVRAFAEEDVRAAVRETVRLRYWENIRESVRNWEEGKLIVLQH